MPSAFSPLRTEHGFLAFLPGTGRVVRRANRPRSRRFPGALRLLRRSAAVRSPGPAWDFALSAFRTRYFGSIQFGRQDPGFGGWGPGPALERGNRQGNGQAYRGSRKGLVGG